MKKRYYKLLSTLLAVCFVLSTIRVFAAQKITIVAYGKDAASFVSLIEKDENLKIASQQMQGQTLFIISDLENVDIARLVASLENGGTIVAINLPVNNKLVPVPTLQEKVSRITFEIDVDEQTQEIKQLSDISEKELYPDYWISIINYDEIISTKNFIMFNENSVHTREEIITAAAEEVLGALPTSLLYEGTWQKKLENSDLIIFGDEYSQYYIRHEVYQLDVWDDVVDKEYWRTDSYIDHVINDYEKTTVHCGPYIHSREIKIDASSASELYRYDPGDTPPDTTVTVNVGFAVTYGGGGFNINYGWSWSNPGVTYDTTADYYQKRVSTQDTFQGPNYCYWPWYYEGPCEQAYESYYMDVSNVMRTNVGSGFDLENQDSTWVLYDDYPYWLGYRIMLDRDVYEYTRHWDPSTISSIFS